MYEVKITYKCAGTAPLIKYIVNTDGTYHSFSEAFSTSASTWTTATFTPSTASTAKNIYTFTVYIYDDSAGAGATHSTYKINVITVIFRTKPTR